MNKFKHTALNLLLIFFGVIAALVVLEFGVRLLGVYNLPAEDFVEPHSELGWSHIPNKVGHWTIGSKRIPVRINSKGLRDREYAYQTNKGVFRILVLGDSFTEAFQVPLKDTFCKVLERSLNQGKKGFEVINAGLGGVGTDYELLFLKEEGYKYHPDLIITAFFPNDIVENYRSKAILDDPQSEPLLYYGQRGIVTRVKQYLADHSHAFNYFGSLVVKHLPSVKDSLVDLGLIGAVPIKEGHKGIHLHYLVLEAEYPPQMEQAWEITELLFERLSRKAESQGCRLAVVSIPFREQVYRSLWTAQLARPEMQRREWNLDRPDELLGTFLPQIGVPLLRLLPEFRKASARAALYHGVRDEVSDGHWNAAGHELAGKLIYRWLVEENLIPTSAH